MSVWASVGGVLMQGRLMVLLAGKSPNAVAQIMDYQRWFVAGVPFELLDAAPDYYMDQWVQHEQAD